MEKSTVESRAKTMEKLLDKTTSLISYLYGRWQDEKEYEDFGDYAKAIQIEVGSIFVKATKRPFGFIVDIPGFPYKVQIYINQKAIGWKSCS